MRNGLFYAYFTHFSVRYAFGGLSDVFGGGGGVVYDVGRNREKKLSWGELRRGGVPGGGLVYMGKKNSMRVRLK